LPVGETIKESSNALEILNEFFYTYTQTNALQEEKQKAIAHLSKKLKACHSFLSKTKTKQNELIAINLYKVWADLLMANLHAIPEHAKNILLPDFNDPDKIIEIPLSETLTPQKNAERYYRKSKNHQIEINRLKEIVTGKEKEIAALELQLSEITETQDLKRLRHQIEQFGLQKKKQTETIVLPYREIEFQGFRIWVGKNAKANDELTLKHSYKEDLWLHAQDVSGSHVLIKYKSGNPFPKEVIERGAQLAAHFSKRKNESLCPVTYTQKKFVRKRKGDPAGLVVVEKEKVILVEPKGL
jgi:predicted ribosome quality control (RQC) complex YloA/Tae2 family protein